MPATESEAAGQASLRQRARTVLRALRRRYRDIATALRYDDPWQLLVATVLSAQTTDQNVNKVTGKLFARWPTAHDLAAAPPDAVEEIVYPTGFFRQKARSIISLSQDIVDRHDGVVPADLDSLVELRGVGRKTASVVLAEAFAVPAIAVDTHVGRVTRRLGLTSHFDPERVEDDLAHLYAREEWAGLSMRFIQFGREVCIARRPRCWECPLAAVCPYPDKTEAPG